MKVYQSKHTKTHSQNPNKRNDHEAPEESLEKIAEELTAMARKRLPDGVLQGILRGHEGDIRQKATSRLRETPAREIDKASLTNSSLSRGLSASSA